MHFFYEKMEELKMPEAKFQHKLVTRSQEFTRSKISSRKSSSTNVFEKCLKGEST
jgi:hypothetical protein